MAVKKVKKAKSEFVLVAAHQLKTPLSALKWVFKMLLEGEAGELTPEQINLLTKGHDANEGMIILVNDLLKVAQLEKGKDAYEFQKSDFIEIVKKAVSLFSEIARQKKIEIITELPQETLTILSDTSLLQMAVSNFIANAINYSFEGGKVTIKVLKKDNCLEFSVEDKGIGIPLSQQKKLFGKFFRGDNAVRLQIPGSGLGLYITKKIINGHGGKVWFESQENKGSKFYFNLPLEK